MQDTVSEAFFEPVIRLGVTGLARSGKTVFITSLVANLLDRGRMPQLTAASEVMNTVLPARDRPVTPSRITGSVKGAVSVLVTPSTLRVI